MTKLRTLKDLSIFSDMVNGDVVFTADARQEAIKWIKAFERDMHNLPEINCPKEQMWQLSGAYKEFIRFFNITEEDLK